MRTTRHPLRALASGLALAAATAAPAARADTPPPAVRHEEPAEPPRTEGDAQVSTYNDTPYLALRLMPIDLISGIFRAGAEIKILPDLTLLPQFAAGRAKHRFFDAELNEISAERRTYLEAELQARYYLVGLLGRGIYLSADSSYTWFDSDQFIKSPLLDHAAGLRLGGSFGGAYTTNFGLGLDMQFLIHGMVYKPKTDDNSPAEFRPGPLAFGASIALTYVFTN